MFILVTGERIAVEYLLAQTNRGDLLATSQVPEIPSDLLEEEDEPDVTVSMPGPASAEEGDPEPRPLVTEVNNAFCNTLLKNTIFN